MRTRNSSKSTSILQPVVMIGVCALVGLSSGILDAQEFSGEHSEPPKATASGGEPTVPVGDDDSKTESVIEDDSESGEPAKAESLVLSPPTAAVTPLGIDTTAVSVMVREIHPHLQESSLVPPNLILTDPPTPARQGPRPLSAPAGDDWIEELIDEGFARDEAQMISPLLPAKSLAVTFDSTDFDTNATNTAGSLFIPPDPHGAAGPNHVVNATNVTLRFHQKDGTLDFDDSLKNFFAVLNPANETFDPKVIYDQFADRWLVLTLELTTAPEGSRLLFAVSDDSNPNGSWTMAAINSLITIGATNHWSDYPGFAIDEEAVYIVANLFSFPGAFGGNRLWIIDKGLASGGFYDGGALSSTISNPVPGGFFASTQQPAHIFDTAPAGIGTWLMLYDGLSNGLDEFVQLIRIDDPLGTPTLRGHFINIGNVDETGVNLPDAPQSGIAALIETADRRALDAVWRNDSLWLTTTVYPPAGDPNAGQATAHWVEIDTTSLDSPSRIDGGNVGGEDIAVGTHTFFPSIAVNSQGDVAIGFSASAGSIFAGSYYTNRRPADTAGTVRSSKTLRAGLDSYVRTFGEPRNRWGDYTGTVVDPSTGCFWFYNEHAIAQGTPTNPGAEEGRWGTAWGLFCSCEGDESTGDSDFDGVCGDQDICPGSDDNVDADGDGVPDGCDACPGSDDNADADADGVPDDCDVCPGLDDNADADTDGVPDGCDICPGSDDNADADADGVPDGCDICPGSDDNVDADGDGVPDGCDACPGSDDNTDADSDGVPDGCDICPGSDDNADADGDGVPDGCDICPGSDDNADADSDGVPDGCDICPGSDDNVDADGDGVPDGCDACPGSDDNADADADGVPDDCDVCPGSDDSADADFDGVPDGCDICPGSDDSVDMDNDGVPDGCDVCLGDDATGDIDGDGFCADYDCDDLDPNSGSCLLFADGFESGNTAAWSSSG